MHWGTAVTNSEKRLGTTRTDATRGTDGEPPLSFEYAHNEWATYICERLRVVVALQHSAHELIVQLQVCQVLGQLLR